MLNNKLILSLAPVCATDHSCCPLGRLALGQDFAEQRGCRVVFRYAGWTAHKPMTTHRKLRKYVRVALPKGAKVVWECHGIRKSSSASVLALGGLFIADPDPPPIGDVISVVLEVPGGEVRARAQVCDSHPGRGMGIRFTSMAPEARAKLSFLMERLTRI